MARKPAEMTEVEQRAITILRDSFEQSEMTHGELAEKVGVARTTILKTFAGSRATYLSEFEGIAKALGLTPWRVMRQAEDALEEENANTIPVPELDLPQEIYGLTPPDPDDYGVYAQRGDVEAEQEQSQQMP
jgi:transcriptional regulator with XRE-family HTH domain|nr:MAG TPA: Regulatory protein-modification, helix-turn-helix, transcriptional regulato, DNA [Caudoviricetes sp.]